MENHYTQELSINELAEISHYSSRHFARLFTETYHTTPLNYILSLRINLPVAYLRKIESLYLI
ncbi:AraC family transcriptional regulator [Clostridium sp.]|uniref:AraC family transcriptional regulator n=1 Tax=Clostridium sp. TaxID=1506 RepID=UPI003FD8F754